jgi:hypothetical protein
MAGKSPTGLMNIGMWEGSKEDVSQDKKLAKKRGMSMTEWEASEADTKHDTQKSMKGLRGGGMATRGMGAAYAEGGMACKAGGGMVTAKGQGMARTKSTSVC